MELIKWLTAFFAVIGLCCALPGRIHIGGIFEEEDDEIELAFRVAVDRLNMNETMLKNSRIFAMVEKLYSQDGLKATELCCGLLQKGLGAIFGPQMELSSMHVQSICDDLEVPHIEARWEYRLNRDQLSINLYPKPSELSEAFVRVVKAWNWEEFIVLYEEDNAIIRLKEFLQEGENQKWDIKLYQFRNDSYRDTFWEIKRAAISRSKADTVIEYRIVLDVPREHLYDVLKAAQQVGMMTEHQKYLITSLDIHTIDTEDFQFGKTNITGLRLVQEQTMEFREVLKEINARLEQRKKEPLSTLKVTQLITARCHPRTNTGCRLHPTLHADRHQHPLQKTYTKSDFSVFLPPAVFRGGMAFSMAAYTFISFSYFLIGRLSPYEWSNPHPCRQNDQVEENVFSLLNSMWFAIGSLMQQGSDIAPTAMSTRAITSIWYFFCLIMISSYTANLAAFLTVEKLVSPIENVEDLANQEKIKYGCLKGGSTYGFFKKSNMSTYRRIFEFMEKNADEVYMKSNSEGIHKVNDGNYAYFMEATSIEYNIERECNLTQVGGLLDNKGYGIAVKKGRQNLRAWLSGGILKLQEQGQLHTFKERWWKQKKGGGSCSQSPKASGSVNELGLGNVGGVFVVMLLGILLSAVMGVIEFFWFQRKLEKEREMSLFKLLMREIKYAVTCGSSSKPAPKLKSRKSADESTKGYNSLY
ncbi:Glutamate receptor ionotropic like protein [Argiope bruennichi]|uniref:Glutamate receptor ionotropic like protein n=1 Tax=Argiope bruennichi TaxID=94029 RepID=A0A8T0FNS9_ARGBR|nr:Glutamate receptor ionotropic like protein [Argiope bruennichi]